MEQDILVQFVRLEQKSLNSLYEIFDLTKQMAEAFSRNDLISAQKLVEIRGDCMKEYDVQKRNVSLLLLQLPDEEAKEIQTLINGEETSTQVAAKVFQEIAQKRKKVLQDTIAIDKTLHSKISGKRTIFNKKI